MADNRPAYNIDERFVQISSVEPIEGAVEDTLDRLVEEMAEGRQLAGIERKVSERTELILDHLIRVEKKLDNLDRKYNSLYQDIKRLRRNT